MGKKTKKFLLICGIVVGAGLLLAIIGAAAGGLGDMSKLADHYTWISGPSADEEQQTLDPSKSFESVKVSGDLDLDIVKGSEDSVKLIYPKDGGTYSMDVENGTLVVNYESKNNAVVQLSGEDRDPRLVITRKDGASIKNIEADLTWGDADLEDLTADTVTLNLDDGDADLVQAQIGTLKADLGYGDLETVNITCGSVTANLDDGDCQLKGALGGNISVTANYGDVDVETSLDESQYTVNAESGYGDIEVGSLTREDGGTLQTGAGSYMMKLYADDGDISVDFGH